MKPLSQYLTPEAETGMRWAMDVTPSNEVVDADTARLLEQKLAACRDALYEISEVLKDPDDMAELAEKALDLTKPCDA